MSYIYRYRNKKELAWRKISEEVGISEEVCRRKWKSLRDTYVKERKREKEDNRSGSAAGTNKKWKYSAVLSFLDPFVTPRKTTSNMVSGVEEDRTSEYGGEAQGADDEHEFSEGSEAEEHHDATADAPDAPPAVSAAVPAAVPTDAPAGPSGVGRAPRGRKRPRNLDNEKEVHERLLEALTMRGSGALPAAPLSEDEHFLQSLLPSLQRLPTQQKNFVKFKIHRSIYEASTVVLNLEFE
ncbi:transcription factor Adf-1-like [Trematomus bernacchii]|uniref:transcription factor Adf-1-like n=1 Tax=Trematomus bernacchii TaxID=40690 RepID=UPI00146B14E7|nr:transcription factor Adf-1-like [Trematomus bernacchii]